MQTRCAQQAPRQAQPIDEETDEEEAVEVVVDSQEWCIEEVLKGFPIPMLHDWSVAEVFLSYHSTTSGISAALKEYQNDPCILEYVKTMHKEEVWWVLQLKPLSWSYGVATQEEYLRAARGAVQFLWSMGRLTTKEASSEALKGVTNFALGTFRMPERTLVNHHLVKTDEDWDESKAFFSKRAGADEVPRQGDGEVVVQNAYTCAFDFSPSSWTSVIYIFKFLLYKSGNVMLSHGHCPLSHRLTLTV